MRPAIRVDGLSKRYRVGRKRPDRNMTEHLRDGLRAAWGKVRQLADPDAGSADTDEFWALKDVSFEVPAGEVVGIIGRNGAGKSTLLKVLSRIVEPTGGSAEIDGRVGALLEVGTGFHPELTGRENVYLNGTILGMGRKEIDRKFDAIVDFSGVEKFLDTPVKRYSSGMMVRLGFAVAAHLEPDVLIVDEVLAVGDAAFQQKCIAKIRQYATDGRTVCFVSHNPQLTSSLCRTGVLLDRGRVSRAGPIDDVLRAYCPADLVDRWSVEDTLRANSTGPRPDLITGFDIRHADGRPGRTFETDDEVVVTVAVDATPPAYEAHVGIAVHNSYGERPFACSSHLTDYEIGTLAGAAEVAIRFRLPNLVPGVFTLDVNVVERSNHVLHQVERILAVEVVDTRQRLKTTHCQVRDYGHVIVPARWEVRRGD
ncbi:MAG: ABC transporter ATP-binding protein [Gemmataceae bacterium]